MLSSSFFHGLNTTKDEFCCNMTLYTYPKLTDAKRDVELIRLWISGKSVTTQKTYITISRQFLTFAGKELEDIKLEDVLLWLESFQLRGFSQNTINNKDQRGHLNRMLRFRLKHGQKPCYTVLSAISHQ